MLWNKRLRKIRRTQDLTQQDLAALAGVNYTTISRIESGDAKQVYIDTAMRLAKALHVTTDELLGMDEFAIDTARRSPAVSHALETPVPPTTQHGEPAVSPPRKRPRKAASVG